MEKDREMEKINIYVLNGFLMINKDSDSKFFNAHSNYFSISIFNLAALLKFLLFRKLMSPKVLEGILSEYYEEERW